MTDDGQPTSDDQGRAGPKPGGASSRRAPPTIDLKSSDYSAASSSEKTEQAAQPGDGPDETQAQATAASTAPRADAVRQYAVPAIAGAIAALIVAGVLAMSGAFKISETPASPPAAAPEKSMLEDLSARLVRLEKTPATSAMDPLLPARVATLEQSAQSARETLAALRRQVDSLSSAIVEVKNAGAKTDASAHPDDGAAKAAPPAISDSDLAVLRERLAKTEHAIGAMTALVAETKAALPDLIAQDTAKQDAAKQNVMNPKLQLFAVALALDLRVRSGDVYSRELQELKNEAKKIFEGAALIKPDDLAALDIFAAKGVPTARQLTDDLLRVLTASAAAHPQAQTQTGASESGRGSIIERLTAHAGNLVRIERVDSGASGAASPGAVMPSLQASVKKALASAQRGDLAAAQAELDREDVEKSSASGLAIVEWISTVKARDAARAASDAIFNAARTQLSTAR